MTYLLDTDTLEHFQRSHAKVLQRASAVGLKNIAITVVTRMEVLQARFEYLRKSANATQLRAAQRWLNASDQMLSAWRIVPLDDAACETSDKLRLVKGLRRIGRPDLLIASVSLANQATLVTRNVKDFALVPGLAVENWVD